MQIDQEKIEAAIIEQAVAEFVDSNHLHELVQKSVTERINAIFKNTAEKQIEDAVSAAIKEGFERPYTKVDSFGKPVGEPTTISAQLEKQIAGYWNQVVDKQGKPVEGGSYNTFGTRAEWVMAQMVADDFKGQMKQLAVNIGGAFKDKLRTELYGTVNGLLSEVFHVRSQQDQKLGNPGRSCIDPQETTGTK